jgi:hypothetical protein
MLKERFLYRGEELFHSGSLPPYIYILLLRETNTIGK